MSDIKTVAEDVLLEIGGNPTNKGFAYIVSAMQAIDENPELQYCIGDLYAEIAKRHNKKSTMVERCIRHEREEILTFGNLKALDKYHLYGREKYPNGMFLTILYLAAIKRNIGGNADAD